MSRTSLDESASWPHRELRERGVEARIDPLLKVQSVSGLVTFPKRTHRSAVCQRCQRPLDNPWRTGGQLCWQCGIDYELFCPETRWTDEAAAAQPPARIQARMPWWRRALGNLRKATQAGALRRLTFLLALCCLLPSSLVRADDCSDALIAEGCACRSTVPSKQEQPASSDQTLPDRRAGTARKAGTHVAQRSSGTGSPSDSAMIER